MNLGQENETQEFKESLGLLDKGLKSLTAMLNRCNRGTVYFGVNDDGDVIGLDIGKRTLEEIRRRAAEMVEPRIVLTLKILEDEDKREFIRVDAEGTDIPYSFDGRYYLRTAAADEKIGSPLLRKMLASGTADILAQSPSENQALTFDGLIAVLRQRGLHASNTPEFFRSFGLLNGDGRFGLMAYLLSDQNDMVIKVMRFAGLDKAIAEERATFNHRSLILSVQDVLDYIKPMTISNRVYLASGIREETPLFDYEAFREAWVNACVHNDWAGGIPPSVYLYDNRIEIVSYGGLRFDLTEEGFFTGTSKPVNARLFGIFISCGLSEQSGHGVPRIVHSYGREAFSFNDGMVTVTLPFAFEPDHVLARRLRSQAEQRLTENQTAMLAYFRENPNATLQMVADACSMSLGGAKKAAGRLQELGLLARKGAKNNSLWVVR